MKLSLFLIFIFSSSIAFCQRINKIQNHNFGFEEITGSANISKGWIPMPKNSTYSFTPDSIIKHSGKYSLLVQPGDEGGQPFGCAGYMLNNVFKGNTIEVKAYLKFQDVKGMVGLMLRIDGKDSILQFDNMKSKKLKGTKDWKSYMVKLPLPANATRIFIGGILSGPGKLWLDDFEILIDGKDINDKNKTTR